MHDPETLKQFQKWGKEPPTRDVHGTPEEIANNMRRLLPNTWRMEGNKLIGETDMGQLVQFIPTDVVLTGVTKDGLPKFEKIKL